MARHGTSTVKRRLITSGSTKRSSTAKAPKSKGIRSQTGAPKKKSNSPPTIAQKKAAFTKFARSIKPGGLHRSLGIPLDQKIGITRIRAAAKRPGLVGQQGRAALAFHSARVKRQARK